MRIGQVGIILAAFGEKSFVLLRHEQYLITEVFSAISQGCSFTSLNISATFCEGDRA